MRRGLTPVRVVSDSFTVPERRRGCYACGEGGLVLLTVRERGGPALPVSGDLLAPRRPAEPEKDRRSGALIVPLD